MIGDRLKSSQNLLHMLHTMSCAQTDAGAGWRKGRQDEVYQGMTALLINLSGLLYSSCSCIAVKSAHLISHLAHYPVNILAS